MGTALSGTMLVAREGMRFSLSVAPLSVATMVGSFVFGIGMQLADTCPLGSCSCMTCPRRLPLFGRVAG